jgi:hypothetical protein
MLKFSSDLLFTSTPAMHTPAPTTLSSYGTDTTWVEVGLPHEYADAFGQQAPPPYRLPQPNTYHPTGKLGQMLTQYPDAKLKALLEDISGLHTTGQPAPQYLGTLALNLALKLYARTPGYLEYFYGFGINLMRHLAAQAPLFGLDVVPIFLIDLHANELPYFLAHTALHSALPEIIGFNLVHFHSLQIGTRLAAALRLERAAPGAVFPLLKQPVRLLAPEPAFPVDCNWPLAAILSPNWRLVSQPAYTGNPGLSIVQLTDNETTEAIEAMLQPFPLIKWPI